MASYISFRDVGAVLTAGGGLAAAGTDLGSGVPVRVSSIRTGEQTAVTSRDQYGQTFWSNSYNANDRNNQLLNGAADVAKAANDIGPNVLTAVRQLVWVDAVHGAALLRTANRAR